MDYATIIKYILNCSIRATMWIRIIRNGLCHHPFSFQTTLQCGLELLEMIMQRL